LREKTFFMSQEPPDLNQLQPGWEEPMTPAPMPPFPDGQPRISDPYLPEAVAPRPPPSQPLPAALREHPAQRARQERLQRLRQQREQSQRLPELSRYQRQGVPPPPPSQLSFKAMLKHWWEHGPFVSPTPRAPAAPKPPQKLPAHMGEARPVEKRVRAWIARGQVELPRLFERAQKTVQQAKTQMNVPSGKGPLRAQEPQKVPGLIVLGFAPELARDDAAQRIAALGGKPLRYKATTNQFQVAVPLGHEEAFVAQFQQVPGVIFADLERPQGQ
jgi:hypothetical protein